MIAENRYFTGAVKDTPDTRDYQWGKEIGGASVPFDWTVGYELEKKLTIKNQGGSFSCGGQAWSYYGQALQGLDEKSAKFIYAQTFVSGGGSGGRPNCDIVTNQGWAKESLCVSYMDDLPPVEVFMEKTSDITQDAKNDAKNDEALSYANVSINIDSIAQAIRDCKGCVIGVSGENNGTWTSVYPKPPKKIDSTNWNHWVYCFAAKIINGIKYIGIYQSWGEGVGDKGIQWLSEEYFTSGAVWSCWTLGLKTPVESPTIPTEPCQLGDRGNTVSVLQSWLIAHGYSIPAGSTSYYGFQTQEAVKEFQQKNHIYFDFGRHVGKLTLQAIKNGNYIEHYPKN